jgi:hypothetical protein
VRVSTLHRKILKEITKPTDRGKQKLIGPSQIGGCPLCIGERLALALPEQYPDIKHTETFGLGSWVGSAVHYFLEQNLEIEGAIKEQKNFIYNLEGYGEIKGSTDFFVDGHIVDWKALGKWMYDLLTLDYQLEPNKIPHTTYRVQQHLYGYGWEQAGYEVKTVNLCIIPKVSNRAEDIVFFTEPYKREVALGALKRLEKIWAMVKDGKLDDLPSDGNDCYRCSRLLFR